MNIGRKKLPHDGGGPLSAANPEGEVYFITICCVPCRQNQLACPDVWQSICETLGHREGNVTLKCRLVLAMPDHFHSLMAFQTPVKQTITSFKSWLTKRHAITWQRDFFDHRLRGIESAAEKAQYIRMNPVRAGLVTNPQDWPYQR
jgi:putative transposase